MRHSRLLRRLPNPPRDFVDDDVVMRSISANQASKANDSVVFLGFGERTGSRGNFKRTGYTDDFDVIVLRT